MTKKWWAPLKLQSTDCKFQLLGSTDPPLRRQRSWVSVLVLEMLLGSALLLSWVDCQVGSDILDETHCLGSRCEQMPHDVLCTHLLTAATEQGTDLPCFSVGLAGPSVCINLVWDLLQRFHHWFRLPGNPLQRPRISQQLSRNNYVAAKDQVNMVISWSFRNEVAHAFPILSFCLWCRNLQNDISWLMA